jgi:hypothetical protein
MTSIKLRAMIWVKRWNTPIAILNLILNASLVNLLTVLWIVRHH